MNRIKQLREREGMSQIELASFLNVAQGTLSNWERGVHQPDTKTLILLSNKFDVTLDYLLGKHTTPKNSYNATQNINNNNSPNSNTEINIGNIGNENANCTNTLSDEEKEIVRIYRMLPVKKRHKIMSLIFDMEEQTIKYANN